MLQKMADESFSFSDSETEGFDELVGELEEGDIISAENSELFTEDLSQEGHDVNAQQNENDYTFTGEQSSFFADREQSAQDETQRAKSPNSGHLSEDELFERLKQDNNFDADDAEVAEILNEEDEARLSVKEKIQLFESVPKAPDETKLAVKSKVVYIPKDEEALPKQELETLYHNAFRNIMNPLFVFASIYASTRLILAVFNFNQNYC